MVFPSGDHTGEESWLLCVSCAGAPPEVEMSQMLLALQFASMSGVATVYATHFPSGEICGSATRCILIMSSKVMGWFAASCAVILKPEARTRAPTRPLRRRMPFISLSYEDANVKGFVERRMMSRFRRESNSVNPRPEPIYEPEEGCCGDYQELATMHASDESGRKQKRECRDEDSTREAESVGTRMLFPQHGQSRGDRAIDEQARNDREHGVAGKISGDGKDHEQHGENGNGDMRS